jgi:hypothetical protein
MPAAQFGPGRSAPDCHGRSAYAGRQV